MKPANEAALDAFLGLIADKGFAAVTLRAVAEAAGLGFADLYRLYPDKVALVAAFMARIDAEVLAGTPQQTDPEETARDRLFDTMMRRYDALRPHRAALGAIRRAGTRDPMLALAMGPALRRSMAAMLEAASVSSEGLSGALRQNGLLAIHYAVSRVFDRDETTDLSKTMAALDSRLKMAEKWSQLLDKYVKSSDTKGPAPGLIRLLREYFVQCTKSSLDLLRRMHKLGLVVHRSKAGIQASTALSARPRRFPCTPLAPSRIRSPTSTSARLPASSRCRPSTSRASSRLPARTSPR